MQNFPVPLIEIVETFEQSSGLTYEQILQSEEWCPLLFEEVAREVFGLNENTLKKEE